ncbi:hypothetical protein RB601_008763 [Gaeumannomyces tritici]
MSSPSKLRPKSPAEAFDNLEMTSSAGNSSSSHGGSKQSNLIESLRKIFTSSYPPSGSVRGRPIPFNFTIKQDEAYDYFLEDDDPDELFEQAVGFHDEVKAMLHNLTPADEAALDEYQLTNLSNLIFGSNLIEGAGAGLDITYKLCQLVFTGQDKGIADQDMLRMEEYDERRKNLVTQDLPTDQANAAYRSRREIIQHARALRHIVNAMVIEDKPLTERLILDTHKILCHKVDSPDGMPYTSYAGIYRLESVVAGFSSFTPWEQVPREMAQLITEFNRDIEQAAELGEMDPYALAAKMCHKFVNIHPFIDGNGRTCRLILNAILIKHAGALVCLGEKEEDRDEYLTIAAKASMAMASDDGEIEQKHHKGLATLTLRHVKNYLMGFVDKLKKKGEE